MNRKSKKILLIFAIILIVSAGFIAAKFGVVSADKGVLYTESGKTGDLYQNQHGLSAETTANESMTGALFKLLGALIIVVAGIYGFLLLLRKMMGRKFSGNRGNNLLEVIETTYIAQKKSVSLVRYGNRAVLVGVGDSGITVLAELDESATSDILTYQEDANESKPGFSHFLKEAGKNFIGISLKTAGSRPKTENAERPQTA
jgi:flagellar biosynthetic protein FliO